MEDTAASTAANTPAQNNQPQESEITDPSDTHVEIRAFTVGPRSEERRVGKEC